MSQHKSAHYEYEQQFAPGAGSPKLRREIDRINRIVRKMLAAGIPLRDIDFVLKSYDRHGEKFGKLVERSEHEFNTWQAKQHQRN